MSQHLFGFDGSCWRKGFQIYNLGQQALGGFRGVNYPVSVPDFLALIIDTGVDGNTVNPCVKLAFSVETWQSSIGLKEHILGNIQCVLMLCRVSLGQLVDRSLVADNQMVES